ncbi:hypothetical protein [Marinicrinis sediminis]|uniref:Uncharacterized protein n=1 Tax=Marinicrinis sediminis TaxID=1652465 RepID=A0ABW5R6Z1_9BACL
MAKEHDLCRAVMFEPNRFVEFGLHRPMKKRLSSQSEYDPEQPQVKGNVA